MRPSLWPALFGVVAVAAAGCPSPKSEMETLSLQGHGITVAATADAYAWTAEQPILVGSRICPTLHCIAAGCPTELDDAGTLLTEIDVGACFTHAPDGPATVDTDGGPCLTVAAPGTISWRYSPVACTYDDTDGWDKVADQFLIAGVDPQGLSARFDLILERIGQDYLDTLEASGTADYVPLDEETVPDDFHPGAEKPVTIVADTRVRLPIALFDADGAPVGYSFPAAVYAIDEVTPGASGPAVILEERVGGALTLTMAAGGEVSVALEIHGERFEVGRVRAVAQNDLSSLSIFAFRQEPSDGDDVVGLRALVRTEEGEVVFGAPVVWEVTGGRYVLSSMKSITGRFPGDVETEPQGDWIYLNDRCRPPSARWGAREASVKALVGATELERTVTWTQVAPENPPPDPLAFAEADDCVGPDPWMPDEILPDGGLADGGQEPVCTEGCCCEQTSSPGPEGGAVGVMVLVWCAVRKRSKHQLRKTTATNAIG